MFRGHDLSVSFGEMREVGGKPGIWHFQSQVKTVSKEKSYQPYLMLLMEVKGGLSIYHWILQSGIYWWPWQERFQWSGGSKTRSEWVFMYFMMQLDKVSFNYPSNELTLTLKKCWKERLTFKHLKELVSVLNVLYQCYLCFALVELSPKCVPCKSRGEVRSLMKVVIRPLPHSTINLNSEHWNAG